MSGADDWPQFRGPNRDGKSAETGLLKAWPEGGPKLIWSVKEDLGVGFSHVAVAQGMIYVTGMNKAEDGELFAFDLDGKLKWKVNYGPEWSGDRPGARTIPTIEKDRLYLISGMGVGWCFEAKSGKKIWSTDTVQEFQGQEPRWGWSESPLIVDDKVICTPGGKLGTLAALDKMTGKTVWSTKGLSELGCYSSPICAERNGKKIIVNQADASIFGVEAQSGKVLWQVKFTEYQSRRAQNINPPSPLYHDGSIFVTSGYNDTAVMLELSADGTSVTRKWTDTVLDNHHGQVVLLDGYLYGSNWLSNTRGNWVCLDWKTGKTMYEETWINKGAVIYADGMLYCYEEGEGTVGLVKPTPAGFEVVSSFKVTQGSAQHWAHPVISDGVLYIRHGNALMAYDIKEKTLTSELEGAWTGYEVNGVPGDWKANVFDKNCEFLGPYPDEWYKGKLTVNNQTLPKQIDFTIEDGTLLDAIGLTVLGIYKMEGVTLTMAINASDIPERPIDFLTSDLNRVFVFKKKK